MSRSLSDISETIFQDLKDKLNRELASRISVTQLQFKLDNELWAKAKTILEKAKIHTIQIDNKNFTQLIRIDNSVYWNIPNIERISQGTLSNLILPIELHLDESDLAIQYAADILGIYTHIINNKIVPPEKIFDGIESTDFAIFRQLYDASLLSQLDENTDLYCEDIVRNHLIILVATECFQDISPDLLNTIQELLALDSSRVICCAIYRILITGSMVHKYLEFYRCLEFLYIILHAETFHKEYNIDAGATFQLFSHGHIRTQEGQSLECLLDCIRTEQLQSIIPKSHPHHTSERLSKSLSTHIYKIRCAIAHYRFDQDKYLNQLNWENELIIIAKLTLESYTVMNNSITEKFLSKKLEHPIGWKDQLASSTSLL